MIGAALNPYATPNQLIGAGHAEANPSLPVESALSNLFNSISRLQEVQELVRQRTEPVMRPSTPEPCSDTKTPSLPGDSNLCRALRDAESNVRTVIRIAEDMLQRLEV